MLRFRLLSRPVSTSTRFDLPLRLKEFFTAPVQCCLISIKKAVSICLSAGEGVEALVHKQETPTAYNGEAYSLFHVHSNFSTFLQHKNQLNAFSLICKNTVVFTTAQIYKIIELQSTESAVFFSEYYPRTIEFT